VITITISLQWYYWLLLAIYACWFGYLAYASLHRSWKQLKVGIKLLSIPGMAVFGAMDVVLLNFVVGTVLFAELPREFTFSQRCSRHKNDAGWRGSIAGALSVPLNAVEEYHI
jgi:hypothetical protein